MMKKPIIFLTHILESISLINEYLQDVTEENFYASIEKQDLVARRLEIIGEAVKNLPDEFRREYPDIPWKRISGMRDILIHQYFSINLTRVWDTVVNALPPLKKQIEQIIREYPP